MKKKKTHTLRLVVKKQYCVNNLTKHSIFGLMNKKITEIAISFYQEKNKAKTFKEEEEEKEQHEINI